MIGMVQRFIEPAKSWQLLTGTRTGYGFYAPQVSSHIEPFFDIYHDEAMVSPYFRLTFSTHEAGLRFQTVFDQHLEKLDQLLAGKELDSINTDLYYRSLDLRVHSLSTSVLNLLPAGIDANRVRASLYLYEVPPLYAVTRLREPFRQAFLKTFDYDYRLHPQ